MINHISITNFAIIENAEVDFEDGLNIITGETGSGKSICIEAISLALGSRADSSCVRTGQNKAIVQLAGDINGEEVVISREVSTSGKNLCRLNGNIVSLAELNDMTKKLADIHGQYDNQSLLDPDYHIQLLDLYKKDEILPKKENVSSIYSEFSQAKQKLISLLNMEKENNRKLDFYKFSVDEIDKANLRPNEDTELESRISMLQNSEKIFDGIEHAYQIMYGESAAFDQVGSALRSIESITSYGQDLQIIGQDLGDVYYKLQDLQGQLRDLKEGLTFSPSELDSSISRLSQIDGLKKKYGESIEDIIEYADKLRDELRMMENFDDEKIKLERNLLDSKNKLEEACAELSKVRLNVAEELTKKIQDELFDLNFPDSKIEINVSPLDQPTENGKDLVEILISTNKGEPLKPLYKVASGGEMSRIMLAFKNVISSYDEIPTLIFDEIDNGISGITASIVAKKLKEIAKSHQILCITHLPQIAAAGQHNYKIYKESDESNTFTNIIKLDSEGKVNDIARLLGGTTITETTLKSAKELIANS